MSSDPRTQRPSHSRVRFYLFALIAICLMVLFLHILTDPSRSVSTLLGIAVVLFVSALIAHVAVLFRRSEMVQPSTLALMRESVRFVLNLNPRTDSRLPAAVAALVDLVDQGRVTYDLLERAIHLELGAYSDRLDRLIITDVCRRVDNGEWDAATATGDRKRLIEVYGPTIS